MARWISPKTGLWCRAMRRVKQRKRESSPERDKGAGQGGLLQRQKGCGEVGESGLREVTILTFFDT